MIRAMLLIGFFFTASVVSAESLHVRTLESDVDPKAIPLRINQKADLTVHLKSAGDVVDGFRVFLIRDSDNGLVETLRSDEQGVVTFLDLEAERYTVILRKTKSQRLISPTVAIGDLRLEVAPPGRVPTQKKEIPEESESKEQEERETQVLEEGDKEQNPAEVRAEVRAETKGEVKGEIK